MSSRFVGVVLAGSLIFSSTGVAAPAGPAVTQVNPWAAFTAMSGAVPAGALCNGQVPVDPTVVAPVAAQDCAFLVTRDPPPGTEAPPSMTPNPPPPPIPVPPVESASSFVLSPLILGLGALLAGGLIYFVVKGKGKGKGEPNSP